MTQKNQKAHPTTNQTKKKTRMQSGLLGPSKLKRKIAREVVAAEEKVVSNVVKKAIIKQIVPKREMAVAQIRASNANQRST